ncbi:Arylamine N-acetyltransferase [Balamuthia mandrillaris]
MSSSSATFREGDFLEIEQGIPPAVFAESYLPEYLERIGLPRSLAAEPPTLSLLSRLVNAHFHSIPFENGDVYLRGGVSLLMADIFEKMVRQRRGGYCFEQNRLMAHVLRSLGFLVDIKEARVFFDDGEHPRRPYLPTRTHILLIVKVPATSKTSEEEEDEKEKDMMYLVDVGFGGSGPRFPLPFLPDTPAQQEGATLVLRQRKQVDQDWEVVPLLTEWELWCQEAGMEAPMRLYRFHLDSYFAWVDTVVANMNVYAHPQSMFTCLLWLTLTTREGVRHFLMNDLYTRTVFKEDGSAIVEKREERIETVERLARLLKDPENGFGMTNLSKEEIEVLWRVSRGGAPQQRQQTKATRQGNAWVESPMVWMGAAAGLAAVAAYLLGRKSFAP